MSFTKGISFHHETNANSNPTINNNITVNTSSEVKTENPYSALETSEVRYS